jgi:hypothetical protein
MMNTILAGWGINLRSFSPKCRAYPRQLIRNAMDNLTFPELLHGAISKPLSTKPPFIAPSRTEIGQEHLGKNRRIEEYHPHVFQYVQNHYVNVLGWLPANPNRPGLDEAIQSVFTFAQSGGRGPYNFFNIREGYAALLTDISDKNRLDPVFMVGPKGSGKTFVQNVLFNTRTQDLYEAGIIWYRAECSKLYKENNLLKAGTPRGKSGSRLTLLDYLAAHIVFVSFKYRRSNPIFTDMWHNTNSQINDIIINKYYAELFDTKDNNIPVDLLIEQFLDFFDRASMEEDTLADFLYFHKEAIYTLLGPQWKVKTKFIANVILSYLTLNKFVPLFVFDGLDNCDYYDDEHAYISLLNEVREFSLKDDKSNRYPRKIIISCREETFNHLQAKSSTFFRNKPYLVFYPKPIDPKIIIQSKVSVATKPMGQYFKTSQDTAIRRIDKYLSTMAHNTDRIAIVNDSDKILSDFASKYPESVIAAIDNNTAVMDQPPDITLKNYVQIMHNGNYRAYIHNFLNAFIYYKLFYSEKPQIDKDKNYVYTEGQMLNGSLYLDSDNKEYELGKCIPNIFYYKPRPNATTWHGLCLLRILQLLKTGSFQENELLRRLRSKFGYDADIIKERFRKALSHGLVRSEYDLNKIKYSATRKGSFLIDYILTDVNLLYYCALDTPLSVDSTDRSHVIRYHSNVPSCWEKYSEGCILTAITMIRYIKYTHEQEMKGKRQHDIYKLPAHFPNALIDGMKKHANFLKYMKDSRYMELKRDVTGLI